MNVQRPCHVALMHVQLGESCLDFSNLILSRTRGVRRRQVIELVESFEISIIHSVGSSIGCVWSVTWKGIHLRMRLLPVTSSTARMFVSLFERMPNLRSGWRADPATSSLEACVRSDAYSPPQLRYVVVEQPPPRGDRPVVISRCRALSVVALLLLSDLLDRAVLCQSADSCFLFVVT